MLVVLANVQPSPALTQPTLLQASLVPVQRYALQYRQSIDCPPLCTPEVREAIIRTI